jgi:FtsH-binding integral membrane protein
LNQPIKSLAIIGLLLLGLFLAIAHYAFSVPAVLLAKPMLFIFLLFLLSAFGLGIIERRDQEKVGFAFMGSFLIKMSLTIAFLLIVLPKEVELRKPIALISVAYYFILLLFQAGGLYRRLMR